MKATNVVLQGVLVLLMVAMATPLVAQSRPVRIYVFTAESKFVDDESKGRVESVLDIQKMLKKKNKEVIIVNSADEAEITLEVMDRGSLDTGATKKVDTLNPIGNRYMTVPVTLSVLHTKMTMGDYSKEMAGQCSNEFWFGIWKAAANDLVKNLVKWIKDNDARIPRK